MANSTGKKKDPESLFDEDLIKRRQEHHAKKLESHQKLKKWLDKHRYRAKLHEIREVTTWADMVISVGSGLFLSIFYIAQAGPPMDNGKGDLIWGYALVALIFILLFAVPAWLMLMAFFYYRK